MFAANQCFQLIHYHSQLRHCREHLLPPRGGLPQLVFDLPDGFGLLGEVMQAVIEAIGQLGQLTEQTFF